MTIIVVRGGVVVDAAANVATRAGDVVIVDGVIDAVVAPGTATPNGADIIDADGLHLLPGAIDPHVHFDEPGRTHWEGFDHGSAAAAAGGVTTVIDMPIDSDPPTLTARDVRAKSAAARRSSRVDVAIWGGLTSTSAHTLPELAATGVIGFKAFACPSGWVDFPAVDETALLAGFTVGAQHNLPVALHCELEAFGHTEESEVQAVRWGASLAAQVGARLHVVHASAAVAIVEARRYAHLTVETCPHYLLLDSDDAAEIGTDALCAPPIRNHANRDALWELLRAGHIDCIASDHSPCPPSLKSMPEPWLGISGVETVRSALFARCGIESVSIETIVRLTTSAAEIFGLRGKGRIAAGYDADIALVDLDASFELSAHDLYCRHRQSPLIGRVLRGRTMRTLVRGRTVFDFERGPSAAGGSRVLGPHGRTIT